MATDPPRPTQPHHLQAARFGVPAGLEVDDLDGISAYAAGARCGPMAPVNSEDEIGKAVLSEAEPMKSAAMRPHSVEARWRLTLLLRRRGLAEDLRRCQGCRSRSDRNGVLGGPMPVRLRRPVGPMHHELHPTCRWENRCRIWSAGCRESFGGLPRSGSSRRRSLRTRAP